jgi:galactokinase
LIGSAFPQLNARDSLQLVSPLPQISTCSAPQLREQVARFYAGKFSNIPSSICLAPGRINLIGEHVDYNSGVVLPFAIDLHSAVAVGLNSTSLIRVSSQLDGVVHELSAAPDAGRWPGWLRYLQGTLKLWSQRTERPPFGFDLAVTSTLPMGAGLSSSASLCVAILSALQTAATGRASLPQVEQPPTWEQAQLCQQVEHQFANVPCGLMDQLVVLAGQRNHLLAIDFHEMTLEPIPWPGSDLSCLLIHTGVQHDLATSEYGLRRATCESAARKLGALSLRSVTLENLLAASSALTDLEFKRARHVVSEIERTMQATANCRAGQAEQLGRLMDESHVSLRDDYEVSCMELDYLVEQVRQLPGVLGARMTGGGFGGSMIALLPTQSLSLSLLEKLLATYESRFGLNPRWLLCQPSSGSIELNSGD